MEPENRNYRRQVWLSDDSHVPDGLTESLLRGVFQVRHCTLTNGVITMTFSSTIQILKVNAVESGVAIKTGKPWERHTAECMLLNDEGGIECVGRLVIPTPLRESVKVGIFRAGFALVVPTFGDQKGDISTRLTSLVATTAAKLTAAPRPLSPA